ncbi:flavin reductase family protein [Streptomyces sp. G-G2]|uniref:flavin reductase family protein n=1 Tax=Streptomyces sp. G-G2 TaxID=3046201 RepID=UPI0024BA0DE0|nr:flavin reductase family protein [Streptomyces sp. G-G2]MDJ0384641.1 flavin reductase family protein [Streptomyces sp. G-G2]
MCGAGRETSVPGVLKTRPAIPLIPANAATPHADGVSNDEFREAMSRLAGGVVLVTAREEPLSATGPSGEDVGMTATAFMSVSLDPPLVLVSLREGSRMDDLLAEQPLWGVSVLAEGQRHVAGRFAMKGRISDRLLFADLPVVRGDSSGALLMGGALATLECRTESRVEAGDHTLVIGRVLTTTLPSSASGPLTHFRGRYRQLGA